MTSTFRTPEGGRIDRATTVEFTFDGETLPGHPGDTLASALLANGRHQVATSIKLGRPRGIAAAWAEDPGGLVQIEEPFPEPMLLATTVELYDGLVAHGLPGQGRLADVPDSARYDAVHSHVDVLVVGAGPAGLTAAIAATRAGARVLVVDRQRELAERTVEMITAEGGVADAYAADVTDEAQCRAMVADAVERFGRLDLLDNNVGIGSRGSVVETEPETWRRVMQVNVESMFLTARQAIPAMIETAGAGAIVNVSSISALRPRGLTAPRPLIRGREPAAVRPRPARFATGFGCGASARAGIRAVARP